MSSMLTQLFLFLQYNSGKEAKENKENTDGGAGPGGGPEATPQSLVGCLTALCSASGLTPEDAFFIAQDSLIASNHPAIGMLINYLPFTLKEIEFCI